MKILEEDLSLVIDELRIGKMIYIRKDYTDQENLIARVLSKIGVRYDQQVRLSREKGKNDLVVDFYLPETNIVIEADGGFGHSRKANKKRDEELLNLGIENIIHIKFNVEEEIEKELRMVFNNGN